MTETLYARLGGEAQIAQLVDRFYENVMADERVNHFFSTTDMTKQKQHQTRFLTYAFGGGPTYSGRSLKESHAHLKADHDHFDWVLEHLEAALHDAGIHGQDAQEAMDRVEQYREHVVH